MIGRTGAGKSTLSNVISGLDPNSKFFPTSAEPESCTQETQFSEVYFDNDRKKPLSVIDSVGFHDPKKAVDSIIIADLVVKLKTCCDYLNLIAIAVNGSDVRLDEVLIEILGVFQNLFGQQFWQQTVIIFTQLSMDTKSVERREKSRGKTDEKIAVQYLKSVEREFPHGKGLQYLFLDACYDFRDEVERKAFTEAVSQLWEITEKAPNLHMLEIKSSVLEMTNPRIKQLIAENEKDIFKIKSFLKIHLKQIYR